MTCNLHLRFKRSRFLVQEPNTDFTCDNMSSFERLLVHALSAYNALNSYSKTDVFSFCFPLAWQCFGSAFIRCGKDAVPGLKFRLKVRKKNFLWSQT
jgi:hypothetical protein